MRSSGGGIGGGVMAGEKASPSISVSYRPRSDARYEGSRRPFVSIPPSVLELRLVNQSINQSQSCQSLSSYASDHSAASHPHSCEFIQSNPSSRQSGMVQPVINEMFATVHAAGSEEKKTESEGSAAAVARGAWAGGVAMAAAAMAMAAAVMAEGARVEGAMAADFWFAHIG
eukprot:scaffold15723_cov128-Isochrysis_galbana.AAC.4